MHHLPEQHQRNSNSKIQRSSSSICSGGNVSRSGRLSSLVVGSSGRGRGGGGTGSGSGGSGGTGGGVFGVRFGLIWELVIPHQNHETLH